MHEPAVHLQDGRSPGYRSVHERDREVGIDESGELAS